MSIWLLSLVTTTVSRFQNVQSLSLANMCPTPAIANNFPSAPLTLIPSFLFTSTPSSWAFHSGSKLILAPVSRRTLVGGTFYSVFGARVFEEIRREYKGVSTLDALYERYSVKRILPVILSLCLPLLSLCLPPFACLNTFL